MREINKIILHCSASSFGSVSVIDKWHKDRGWSECGYHYVICNGYENSDDDFEETVMNGEVQEGRDLNKAGAHARGYNADSIGICMIGTDKFSEEQFISLGSVVIGMMTQFDLQVEDVIAHADVDTHGKTCPNFNVKDFMDKYVLSEYVV